MTLGSICSGVQPGLERWCVWGVTGHQTSSAWVTAALQLLLARLLHQLVIPVMVISVTHNSPHGLQQLGGVSITNSTPGSFWFNIAGSSSPCLQPGCSKGILLESTDGVVQSIAFHGLQEHSYFTMVCTTGIASVWVPQGATGLPWFELCVTGIPITGSTSLVGCISPEPYLRADFDCKEDWPKGGTKNKMKGRQLFCLNTMKKKSVWRHGTYVDNRWMST